MKKYSVILCLILVLAFVVACEPARDVSKPITEPETKVDVKQPVEKAIEPKQEIATEVKELLDKHKTRVKSIYYKYRGPETGTNFYEFYIKDYKIKYNPFLEIKSLDKPDSYDSIFIDNSAKTAQSYCIAAYCAYKGKKADLNYNDAYISTVFDWVDGLVQAKKIGEEVIDNRNTWKIETNKGVLWIDTFYGIPLKVDSSGKTYKFEQISVNSVQDSDVMP
jgi:hypothetical protein